ncbi:hypothetical protein GCM10011579_019990 [Streptomyces albiflavescens]|uniref:Uncharacterized protein n=1 Tax=Streptomyces albiflavescens TaxID=1623582 RepID=A0A917XXK1_9ACTN|nr:hypothetical protein [Streptomyces albiflavescens]GGN57601.1 hypothetical protein GCM10011579_019990 [Streptomyces albiflavescens]
MTDVAAVMTVHLGSTTASAPAVRGDIREDSPAIADFGRLGLFVACPGRGVSSDRLCPYMTVDHFRDRALRLVIRGGAVGRMPTTSDCGGPEDL